MKIGRVIDICNSCDHIVHACEDGDNCNWFAICRKTNTLLMSGINNPTDRIVIYIPDNCPLEDYKQNSHESKQ